MAAAIEQKSKEPRVQVKLDLDEDADPLAPRKEWDMIIMLTTGDIINEWHIRRNDLFYTRAEWEAVAEGKDGVRLSSLPHSIGWSLRVWGGRVNISAVHAGDCDDMNSTCVFPHALLAAPLRAALKEADLKGYKFRNEL